MCETKTSPKIHYMNCFLWSFFPVLLCAWQMSAAETVSGTWSGNPFYMILKQEGGKLTGTCGPGKNHQTAIENGQIQGDRITFRAGPFAFDLHIRGDEIEGTAQRGDADLLNIHMRRATATPGVGAASPLEFDAASVKQSKPSIEPRPSEVKFTTGRFTCSNVPLRDLLAKAYEVEAYQIAGPDWMESELYDVIATTAPATSSDDVLSMLQHLLLERFNLKLHRETKDQAVYGLLIAKSGPRLKGVDGIVVAKGVNSPGRLMLPSVSMEGLANILSWRLDRPVLDMTGLRGYFEVNLEWTPDGYRIKPPGDGDPQGTSFFEVIEKQAGLKLEGRKAPVEMIVVDQVNKVPVPN